MMSILRIVEPNMIEFLEYKLTVEPVVINSVWYLNISPAELVSVFDARSALTISVLRINDIPEMTKLVPVRHWSVMF